MDLPEKEYGEYGKDEEIEGEGKYKGEKLTHPKYDKESRQKTDFILFLKEA